MYNYLTIRKWAVEDRPREKLIHKGPKALTNAELLGILLRAGVQNVSAVDLAKQVLQKYDNDLERIAQCSVQALQNFKGIGEAKAVTIVSALELGRRYRKRMDTTHPRPVVKHAQGAYEILRPLLADRVVEEFWVILLSRAGVVIKKACISQGGIAITAVDPKIIFKLALEHHATSIVLAHNHPSGSPKPSKQDLVLTAKIIAGAKALDLAVLDHVIISRHTYYSFADEGKLAMLG